MMTKLKSVYMVTLPTLLSGFCLPALALPRALPSTFTQAAGSFGGPLNTTDILIVSLFVLAGALALWAVAAAQSSKKSQKRS